MSLRKNGKKKYILSVSCTLLAVVTAGVAVMSTTQTALARATLPGVEKIIEGNGTDNPFVVLEIVPEKEAAALGFLVAGEEPVDGTAKSIKDMPSFDERIARFANAEADDEGAAVKKIEQLGIGNAVGYETFAESDNAVGEGVKNVDIRGVFEETEDGLLNGDYSFRDATEQYDTITIVEDNPNAPADNTAGEYTIAQALDFELFRRHIAFRPTGEGIDGTNYAVKLKPLGDTTDLPVKFVHDVNAEVDEDSPVIEAYNHQYFVIEDKVEVITKEVTDEGTGEVKNVVDTEAMEKYLGEMIYRVNWGDDGEIESLSYAGVLTNAQQAMLMFARPPVREDVAEDKTVSENEIETETETESTTESAEETTETTTEPTTETETPPESTTETTTEPTTPPETTDPSDTSTPSDTTDTTETPPSTTESVENDEDNNDEKNNDDTDVEPSGGDLSVDNQAMAFTTKKMARMSIKLDVLIENIGKDIQYVVVKEADGSDSDADVFYYISSVGKDDNADLVAAESYNRFIIPDTDEERTKLIGETFYVRKDNTLPYEYKPANDGTHTFTADYTQEIYDTVSYKGGFTNKEWFKKYVFDLDDDQLEEMCIDVVTVTLDELNENPELLDKADLIYFGDIDEQGFADVDEPTVTVPADKWLVEFDFDDGNGFSSGNAAITQNGGPQSVAKDGGNALYFDGVDDYLTVSNGLLTGVEELTISFVMKTDGGGRANWPYYVAPNTNGQTYKSEKYIGMLENTGSLIAERYNSENQDRPGPAEASCDTGVWTDVTVVYTGSETRIYVDGILADTQESSVKLNELFASGSVFQIGKANWNTGEYFKGWLDDFTIANYAMTEEEVQVLSGNTSVYSRIMNAVGENVPVAVNKSLYTKDNNSYELKKLAAAFMQNTSSNVFGRSGMAQKAVSTLSYQDMSASLMSANAYVNGNIFVYDDADKQIVSGDFNAEIYDSSEITAGFTDVEDEIENENFYLEVAGKEDRISDKITMATAIRHIINHEDKRVATKTSLRVLDLEPYDFEDYYEESAYQQSNWRALNVYEGIKTEGSTDAITVNTIATDSICITDGKLDKKRWLIDNIASQFEGNESGLDVTIMGTKEFVGKIDDLNAEYDLIYLGLDTSIMNTEIETNSDGKKHKTANTVYNDSDMNGLIYAHVGDEVYVDSDDNFIHGTYRMSGNDITYDKLRELKEYIEAGYAVIISDDFLKTEGSKLAVDTKKIDISSNMYTLINDTVLATDDNGAYRYYGKNVNSKSNLEEGTANYISTRDTFNRYLGISKLTLKYTDSDMPNAYNEADGVTGADYLSPDSDGIYRLYYNVELENNAAVSASTTTYDCKLYVDIDADGRYEEAERLTGLSIADSNGNGYQQDGNGCYRLKADEKYRIVREIPEGYSGFLAWKLVFEMNDRTYSGTDDSAVVRSHIIGYSAVPVSGVKPVINVLQITTHNPQLGTERVTTLDLDDAQMHVLYDAVQDFDIEITQIPASRYVDKNHTSYNGNESYSEYLKKYDMVVMGFKDVYEFGNGVGYDKLPNGDALTEQHVIESMLAIREYALSGRSMMFTHDLNSPRIDSDITLEGKRWGWYANNLLRDIQGIDRFGVLQNSTLIPGDEKYKYVSKYDKALLKGESVENNGLASSVVINHDYKTQDTIQNKFTYGENARRASWLYRTHLNYHAEEGWRGDSAVSQVNSGQITEYPYNIADTFAATHSHPQYMQLNLDTDSRDENNDDDIVVWYSLDKIDWWKDSYFAANEMDVRNNFFIYNKGNITYTGSGDGGQAEEGQFMGEIKSEMEKKLFVNTLVASYRSGTHAARALFKESEWETSATITSTYLPYDPAMNDGSGGFLNQELTLNFKTTNMDLRKSDEPIMVKFYVEGTENDCDLAVDGNYYKEITPESIDRLVVQDGGITKVPEQTTVIANNSMHQVKFKHEKLGLMDGNTIRAKNATTLYIRLGYEEMVNGNISLPATESITGLNIVCTQLFELK